MINDFALPSGRAARRLGFLILAAGAFAFACSGGSDGRPDPVGPGGTTGEETTGRGGEGGSDSSASGGALTSGGEGGVPTSGGDGDGEPATGGSAPLLCDEVDCGIGTCEESEEGATCDCPAGFSGMPCADENECVDSSVCPGQACTNVYGSYYCSCEVGQTFEDEQCVSLDECELGLCDLDASCAETDDGYECSCNAGSYGNGWDCSLTDECSGHSCGEGSCVTTSDGPRCQCAPGTRGRTDCQTDCSTLDIVDPNLRFAIERMLGTYISTIDPATDLAGRYDLTISDVPITTLDGLECWPHLRNLAITGAQLGQGTDATPLAALSQLNQLETLDLKCSAVDDLDALAYHPTLRSLVLGTTNCPQEVQTSADLTVLGTLKRLERLDISGLGLSDLDALDGARALRVLFAADNELVSVEGLSGASALQELRLPENQLTDLDALSGLQELETLDLSDNPLASATLIPQHPKLQSVTLSRCGLSTMPSLAGNSRLVYLDLLGNELTTANSVAEGPRLSVVNFDDNQLTTLQPFLGTSVSVLGARGNDFDCDALFAQFEQLSDQGTQLFTDCQ